MLRFSSPEPSSEAGRKGRGEERGSIPGGSGEGRARPLAHAGVHRAHGWLRSCAPSRPQGGGTDARQERRAKKSKKSSKKSSQESLLDDESLSILHQTKEMRLSWTAVGSRGQGG